MILQPFFVLSTDIILSVNSFDIILSHCDGIKSYVMHIFLPHEIPTGVKLVQTEFHISIDR